MNYETKILLMLGGICSMCAADTLFRIVSDNKKKDAYLKTMEKNAEYSESKIKTEQLRYELLAQELKKMRQTLDDSVDGVDVDLS